jgi:hypothetical protein
VVARYLRWQVRRREVGRGSTLGPLFNLRERSRRFVGLGKGRSGVILADAAQYAALG